MRSLTTGLLAAAVCSSAFAGVVLSTPNYRYEVLNEQINVPSGILTFKQVLNLIEAQTGYTIINKVDEIPMDKKYVALNRYKVVGDLLRAVLQGYDAIVDVDQKYHIIKIIYPEVIYIDLPYGWPMGDTQKEFQRLFPYVRFYIEGNRITAYGTPEDIAKLVPYFKNYQEKAYKKDEFRISLYPYCTSVKDYVFLARRKYYGSEQYKPIKAIDIKLGQDEKVAISYGNININITYNKALSYMQIGKYKIPLSKISTVGLAFRASGTGEDKGEISSYLDRLFSKKDCKDVILTIDRAVIPSFY